ncbi:hypothetical protein [Streptomyces sp. NPDC127084]|uniref:hypothetical protein n=1 Tax=Streptomyces sp. NPDC127084 TaxID=3347133 RepID=UPI00365CE4C2
MAAAGLATMVGTSSVPAVAEADTAEAHAPSAVAKGDGADHGYGDDEGGEDKEDKGGSGDKEDTEGEGGRGYGDHEDGYGNEDAGGHGGKQRHGHEGGATLYVECDPADLAEAVTELNADRGGELFLAEDCTYTLTANGDGNGLPVITQPITIHGNGSTIERAADADQFRFFEVGAGGDLGLRDLTLTGAKSAADDPGGAVRVRPAGRFDADRVTFDDNTVDDTFLDSGGAIYNEGVTAISRSSLSGNTARDGGAIHSFDGKLKIDKSELVGNFADLTTGRGGALLHERGATQITNSLFDGNQAFDGGGTFSEFGVLGIKRSDFTHNFVSNSDAAIYHQNGSLYLSKSLLKENVASTAGGGLNLLAPGVIEHTKIKDNVTTGGTGGGLWVNLANTGGAVSLRHSKVVGNQAPGGLGGGIHVYPDTTLILTDTSVEDNISDVPAGGVHNEGTVEAHGKNRIINNVPTNCEGSPNPVPDCFG